MDNLDKQIFAIKNDLVDLRKALHRIPEPGFKEVRTSAMIAGYMKKLGLEVASGISGTGVVGLLRGSAPGPTTAIRACLDALEIEEPPGVEYVSQNRGFMHACGHDGNMTMALGAAHILAALRDQFTGNVKFIFQPSEENTGGAAAMIRAGVLKNPDVDFIVTLHNWHGLPQGVFAVKAGPVLASSDLFLLKIIGNPGHGAWPHLAVDPIVIAAEVINLLQSIVSREIDPLTPAALSIGKIHGGTAVNIIPETVSLEGTVRTYDRGVRDFIQVRIDEITRGVCQAARASCELTYQRVMPPACNDPRMAERVGEILAGAFGVGNVTTDFSAGMGCEEFALFQEQVPGTFLFIGNDKEGCPIVPIHSPEYVFNDEILLPGARALCEIALGLGNS